MIFFMAIVSPSVFATLSTNASSKFLRTIFPRMFLFGFIISILSLIFTFISGNILNSILLIIIAKSFIINRNYLTPKINNLRDRELEGDEKASSNFKYMHLLSVLLFILNFIILPLIREFLSSISTLPEISISSSFIKTKFEKINLY